MAYPFFVVLLAVYPVLFIAVSNPGQAPASSLAIGLAAAAGASLVAVAVLRFFFGSWERAAVGVAVLLVLFYAYGPVHSAFELALLNRISATARFTALTSAVLANLHIGLTAVAVCLASAGLMVVRRLRASYVSEAVRALNIAGLALLLFVSAQSWTQAPDDSSHVSEARRTNEPPSGGRSTSILGYNPDIYMIVMDGYARADVLKEHYRFDNSIFLNELRSRGFRISSRSTANYHWTFLSLASALNMDYVEPLMGGAISPASRDRRALYDAIDDNAVMRFLSARGYRTVHLQSTWGATLENRYADQEIPCHGNLLKGDFIRALIDASWLKTLNSRVNADLASCHLSNFRTLASLGSQPGPKFVFAHFLLPHHPYLFDRNGRILRKANLSNQFDFQRQLWEERGQYIDQLVFLSRRMTEAVDGILAKSAKPPVIILMSDHGPNIYRGLTEEQIQRVRFANFGAFLLSGAQKDVIPPSWSLVNVYRRLFNYYFEVGLELHFDRYYSSTYEAPFELQEVRAEWR